MEESRHEPQFGNAIPPVFHVVGENRNDPDCLLLLGNDGQHYRYHLYDGTTSPTVLDEQWIIDRRYIGDDRRD